MSEAMEGVKKDVQKEKWKERKDEMRKWRSVAGKMKQKKKELLRKGKAGWDGYKMLACWKGKARRREEEEEDKEK